MRRLLLLSQALLLAVAAFLLHRFLPSSSFLQSSLRCSPAINGTIETPTPSILQLQAQRNLATKMDTEQLPPADILSPWLVPRLTKLYETVPTEQDDSLFSTAFYDAFAENVKVVINHKDSSLDELREHFGAGKFMMKKSSVQFKDVIEVVEGEGNVKEGLVAGFFYVERLSNIRIRVGNMKTTTYHSFSAKIETDSTLPESTGDRRRITQFFVTQKSYSPPAAGFFRGPNHPNTGGAQAGQSESGGQ